MCLWTISSAEIDLKTSKYRCFPPFRSILYFGLKSLIFSDFSLKLWPKSAKYKFPHPENALGTSKNCRGLILA